MSHDAELLPKCTLCVLYRNKRIYIIIITAFEKLTRRSVFEQPHRHFAKYLQTTSTFINSKMSGLKFRKQNSFFPVAKLDALWFSLTILWELKSDNDSILFCNFSSRSIINDRTVLNCHKQCRASGYNAGLSIRLKKTSADPSPLPGIFWAQN